MPALAGEGDPPPGGGAGEREGLLDGHARGVAEDGGAAVKMSDRLQRLVDGAGGTQLGQARRGRLRGGGRRARRNVAHEPWIELDDLMTTTTIKIIGYQPGALEYGGDLFLLTVGGVEVRYEAYADHRTSWTEVRDAETGCLVEVSGEVAEAISELTEAFGMKYYARQGEVQEVIERVTGEVLMACREVEVTEDDNEEYVMPPYVVDAMTTYGQAHDVTVAALHHEAQVALTALALLIISAAPGTEAVTCELDSEDGTYVLDEALMSGDERDVIAAGQEQGVPLRFTAERWFQLSDDYLAEPRAVSRSDLPETVTFTLGHILGGTA